VSAVIVASRPTRLNGKCEIKASIIDNADRLDDREIENRDIAAPPANMPNITNRNVAET
jgi:hypothetical protein